MDLTKVIQAISNLPSMCLKLNTDESKGYNEYVENLELQYKCIGLWLNYYLLERQELYEILIKPNVGYYRPLAEKIGLDYKFLQEIKLLSPEFQTINIIDFLYLLQNEEFTKSVIPNSFYPKIPRGKRQTYQIALEREKIFINIVDSNNLKFVENTTYSPREKMMSVAIEIASHPDNRLFKSKYREYLRALTRCDNTIRNTEYFQFIYLSKEILKISGDGKRSTPPKRTGKGFKNPGL